MSLAEIPRIDQPGPDAAPRAVQFTNSLALPRRGFLQVAGTAAMTLGLTVLGWIPLARPARAEAGSEYPHCGRYHPKGGGICYGAPFSPSYCGEDNWFKEGCYGQWDQGLNCYTPRTVCRAQEEPRNAWRWRSNGVEYRCADGEIQYSGAPNLEPVICNATLS